MSNTLVPRTPQWTSLASLFVISIAAAHGADLGTQIGVDSPNNTLDAFQLKSVGDGQLGTGSISLKSDVSSYKNGQYAKISWSNVPQPDKNDILALFVGEDFQKTNQSPANYRYTSAASTYKDRYGTLSFHLLNMRQPLQVAFIRGGPTGQVAAILPKAMVPANVHEPTQGHLSLTSKHGEMKVHWTSKDVSGTPRVMWDTKPNSFTKNVTAQTSITYEKKQLCGGSVQTKGWLDPGFLHTATLSNLPEATQIHYKYGSDHGFSEEKTFMSTPDPKKVKVIVTADVGQQPRDNSNEPSDVELGSLSVTEAITKDVTGGNGYSMVLHNGDLAYADGYLSNWEIFQEQIEAAATAVPWMTTDGNHERDFPNTGDAFKDSSSDSRGECGRVYKARFPMPVHGNPENNWYSFDHGPIHFLMFSSEVDYSAGSPQHSYIQEDLRRASQNREKVPWIIVSGHRPLYVSSTNNKQIPTGDQYVAGEQRKAFEKLFNDNGVDLVFGAHIHMYQRTKPVFNNEGVEIPADGVAPHPIYVITGNGGRALSHDQQYQDKTPWIAKLNDRAWGYVQLEATMTELKLKSVATKSPVEEKNPLAPGTIIDEFTLKKKSKTTG